MQPILHQLKLQRFDTAQKPLADIVRHHNRNQYALDAQGQLLGLHLSGEQHASKLIEQLLQGREAANLQYLRLSQTVLTSLQLPPLARLKALNLSENKNLRTLSFAAALPQLQSLHLYGCTKLGSVALPAGCNALQTFIAYDTALTDVQLQGNCPQLRRVELHNNENLQNLQMPSNLINLEAVYLDKDARLQNIPPEILNQGAEGVAVYFKSLSKGTTEVYEVKMLIVGEGETGKTTLWKKLQNPKYMPTGKEESTVGIQIKEAWSFEHTDKSGTQCLVNMWDFGGQEIQYMTHQFFLTPRSLYVLLADGRREVANFSYWLKIIDLLGRENKGDTSTTTDKIPVLVILNEKGSNNAVRMPYHEESVKTDFPHLQISKREVDFGKEDGRFAAVQTLIQQSICRNLSHLPLKMPSAWQAVREELYKLRKTANHIDEATYIGICQEQGITDPTERHTLLILLRDLGIVLYYDNLELADFIVLNPEWALNAIYEILRHKEVGKNKGRFDENLLKNVWKDCAYKTATGQICHYSNAEQGKLLSLMLKDNLDVCFKAQENNQTIYIAPQLLENVQRPEGIAQNSPTDLSFIYQYPFMPKGIIGRLMVRLNEQITRRNKELLVWNKGMSLDIDGCTALVEEAEDTTASGLKTITISVRSGDAENRKIALRDVRKAIDNIHAKSFSSLTVNEQIPCICDCCQTTTDKHFYTYSILLEAQKKGSEIQCQKSFESLAVHNLLGATLPTDDIQNTIAQIIAAINRDELATAFDMLKKTSLDNNDTIAKLRNEYVSKTNDLDFNGRLRTAVANLNDIQKRTSIGGLPPITATETLPRQQQTPQPWWKKLWVQISTIAFAALIALQALTGFLSNVAGFFNDAFGIQIGNYRSSDTIPKLPINTNIANDTLKKDSIAAPHLPPASKPK